MSRLQDSIDTLRIYTFWEEPGEWTIAWKADTEGLTPNEYADLLAAVEKAMAEQLEPEQLALYETARDRGLAPDADANVDGLRIVV